MQVTVNEGMLALLGGDPEFYEPSAFDVPEPLKSYFAQGFQEVEGCLIPVRFATQPSWAMYLGRLHAGQDDETGTECGISHVHLEGLADLEINFVELARLGCDYAWDVRRNLVDSNIQGLFQVIVAVELPEPGASPRPNCNIRIHRVRPDQAWLSDVLNDYKSEAIMTLRFRIPVEA